MARHRAAELGAAEAARELGLSRARFYKLYSHYLRACAQGQAERWSPGRSGGDHHPAWPEAVTALLTKLLSSKPPSSYSAAASELHRRLRFETDRASVRRWAIEHQLAPDTRHKAAPKPVKRWQARDLDALWQYDATPHAFLPGSPATWWPFIWSQRTPVRIGDDGKVPVGAQRQTVEAPPRSTVIRCLRPDGDIYYLRHAPDSAAKPVILLHCPLF